MSHRIGAAGPVVPPRGPLSAVPPRSSDSPTCPPWCTTDHAADIERRREVAEAVVRRLAAEGLHRSPMVDTYLLHQVEVGRMTVRTGRAERPAPLRVVVEQLQDIEGTGGSLLHPWAENQSVGPWLRSSGGPGAFVVVPAAGAG